MSWELFDLKGRVVVATGAGGVLVGALCRGLAHAGARVAVLDIDAAAAGKVASELAEAGADAISIRCDVLELCDLEAAREEVRSHFGGLDVLINGAGGNKKQASTSEALSFFDLPADALRWVLELNLLGTLLPCQVFGRVMAEQKRGCVLNISSMNASRPLTRIPAYSAAKAAVSNFTQWLAVHMAFTYSPAIRVNALQPGFFLTEQNRFLLQSEDGGWTERGERILDHTPAGRFGAPEDLLAAAIWLLSPGASFVTGAVVPIDGGFSAFSGV
ncbi:MAG: SDR family oxidoreductase [Deltaproteobacteria bacterium]|nr:SDR family oxidoreductase [Deltaproteobacteria bacterium]